MPANINPATMNLSTDTALIPGILQQYYDRTLLENTKPKLVFYQYGQKRGLPQGSGKTIQFRKWGTFDANTTPLTEGQPPNGQKMEQTEVTATIKQYGDFVALSDLVQYVHLDPILNAAVTAMSDQAALTLDTLTRDAISAGTNVLYAAGTSRAGLTAADVLTSKQIRQAVRSLKNARAPRFARDGSSDGYYLCIVSPDTTYTLQDDPDWKFVAEYQAKEKIYTGEIGKLYGVVFVETTQAPVFDGAGSGGIDVSGSLVFGRNAYGVVDLGGVGKNMKTIIKPRGSAGTSDPLDQITTVGWKIEGYTSLILQPDFIVRVEHANAA